MNSISIQQTLRDLRTFTSDMLIEKVNSATIDARIYYIFIYGKMSMLLFPPLNSSSSFSVVSEKWGNFFKELKSDSCFIISRVINASFASTSEDV